MDVDSGSALSTDSAKATAGYSDGDVIAKVVAGEMAQFEVLMRRHNPQVYRAVRAILRDEAEVEDAMQQAYLSAYAHLRQFNGAAKFSTWLTRIAINEALSRARQKEPRIAAEDGDLIDSKNDPEEKTANAELRRLLRACIDELPEIYRVVFVLREVDGMDTADTAATLSVTEDVVKTRLHRAKELLQKSLDQRTRDAKEAVFPFLAPRCDRVVKHVLAALGAPLS